MAFVNASETGTAWLGMEDLNRRIRPRATSLDLRDNLARGGASLTAETPRVRAACYGLQLRARFNNDL